MPSHLIRGGLRAQLTLAISLVTVTAVGTSFLALYSGTGSRLQGQLDNQLRTQVAEWHQVTSGADVSSPGALTTLAQRFIAGQRYHAEALIIAIQVLGRQTVTNDPEILALDEAREHRAPESAGLLDAPIGLATAPVAGAGSMRVLSEPIMAGTRQVGVLRVADPLAPVSEAQASLKRTFLVVGILALMLAIAAGIGLATVIAAPLRHMAGVATAVEAGDLTVRARRFGARGEVGVLAEAFNHMLERLQRTFARQRDFVSDASHELRTPLAVLRAQAELLDRQTDEQQRHEGVRMLLRRLDELDRLVADMLTLASAEAGQLVEPQEIDLADFFEDLRRDLPLFGERDFRLDPVAGTLTADPDRLTQVLRNVVRNAVAHTNPGDTVTVAAHARDHRLEIAVSDSGPGIPEDQLEEIFERFHRVDPARSRDRGGTGLGLAIARAIVVAHGGTIKAESQRGRGATFRIVLPGYKPVLPRPRPGWDTDRQAR